VPDAQMPAAPAVGAGALADRVATLETQVAELRMQVQDLLDQFGLSRPGHPESNDRA